MQELVEALMSHIPAMWRRRWVLIAVAWIVCLAGWAGVAMIPNSYSANTNVFVETESLLRPLLQGMTVDVTSDRLGIMNQTLISRPNLERVVRMVDMAGSSSSELNAAVERLEENISVRLSDRTNVFTISYNDGTPDRAYRVVQALLSIFVETNLGTTRQELDAAREFIGNQVREYQARVAEAERRLSEYRQHNAEYLPNAGGTNLRSYMDELRREIAAIKAEIADNAAKKRSLDSQLTSLSPTLPSGMVAQSMGPSPLAIRVDDARRALDDLKLRYTDKHPAMESAQRQLAELEQQLANERQGATNGSGPAVAQIPNPLYENVRMESVNTDSLIATLKNRLERKEQELATLSEDTSKIPEAEAQYQQLIREADLVRKQYEELLSRQEAARLSQSREMEAEKVQFRVINPPVLPQQPSGVQRALLLSVVLVAGIAAGLGVTFLLSAMQTTFVSAHKILHSLHVPVIGTVSFVAPKRSLARNVWLGAFVVCFVALVSVWGSLMLIERQVGLPAVVPAEFKNFTQRLAVVPPPLPPITLPG